MSKITQICDKSNIHVVPTVAAFYVLCCRLDKLLPTWHCQLFVYSCQRWHSWWYDLHAIHNTNIQITIVCEWIPQPVDKYIQYVNIVTMLKACSLGILQSYFDIGVFIQLFWKHIIRGKSVKKSKAMYQCLIKDDATLMYVFNGYYISPGIKWHKWYFIVITFLSVVLIWKVDWLGVLITLN